MKKITESVIQRACLDYLGWYSKSHKIYFFRSAAGHVALENGRYFKSGKPGVPDITVCAPRKQSDGSMVGVFYGIEVKTKTGRQSALQKQAEEEIVAAGGRYFIVRSLSELKEIFPMEVKK